MRRSRLFYLLLALYFTFIGGGTYYATVPVIRMAHHVLVTFLLAWWLLRRIRTKQGLPLTPLNPPIYAAGCVWLVSAFFSIDTRMALENVWFLFTHVLLFFYVVSLIQRGYQRMVMEILFFMAAIVLLLSGIELLSWYFGLGITPGASIGWIEIGRFPTLADIPNLSMAMGISTLQAGYTAPLIIVAAGWGLTTTNRNYRIVLLLMSALLLLTLILTASRGGLLSLLTALGTYALLRLAQNKHLTKRVPLRWILAVSGSVVAFVLGGFVLVTLPLARGNSDSGRLDMYRSAVVMTADYPITGVGPGIFGRAFRSYRNPEIVQEKLASAHNLVLNTAAELGIPGLVVGVWLLVTFIQTVQQHWEHATNPGHRRRIEFVVAALAGISAHSMVDVFSITPIILMFVTLAAYAITPHPRSRLDALPEGHPLPAIVALVLVIAYGIAFIPLDRAQQLYLESWNTTTTEEALSKVRAARQLDPSLTLYTLHEAYILGAANPDEEAVAAYQRALALEPTWKTGWINLALLKEQRGNPQQALEHLEQAIALNTRDIIANFNWARIAEAKTLASDTDIIVAYEVVIQQQSLSILPLSEYWYETPVRQQAVGTFLEQQPPDMVYRVLEVHAPSRLQEIVPQTAQSASEWWIVGQYALTVEDNPQKAVDAFTYAITLAPHNGDYYVSRARASLAMNSEQAEQDAITGHLLGTRDESALAVLAQLALDEDTARNLKTNAVPIRSTRHEQEFGSVLYGRPVIFDVLPGGRPPGPGGSRIRPWLDVAYFYVESGQLEAARTGFAFILSQAPFQTEAREQYEALSANRDL